MTPCVQREVMLYESLYPLEHTTNSCSKLNCQLMNSYAHTNFSNTEFASGVFASGVGGDEPLAFFAPQKNSTIHTFREITTVSVMRYDQYRSVYLLIIRCIKTYPSTIRTTRSPLGQHHSFPPGHSDRTEVRASLTNW